MKIREIREEELDYLWNFEKENREFDKKTLGDKFNLFYISEISEKEKEEWLKNLRESFQNPNTQIFIAEEKKKIIGYTWIKTYSLNYLNPKKKVGFVNEMFVTKEFRGKGISKELMEKSIKWFKKQGIEFVSLSVFAQNRHAIEIYKKFGFESFSVYMRKRI